MVARPSGLNRRLRRLKGDSAVLCHRVGDGRTLSVGASCDLRTTTEVAFGSLQRRARTRRCLSQHPRSHLPPRRRTPSRQPSQAAPDPAADTGPGPS